MKRKTGDKDTNDSRQSTFTDTDPTALLPTAVLRDRQGSDEETKLRRDRTHTQGSAMKRSEDRGLQVQGLVTHPGSPQPSGPGSQRAPTLGKVLPDPIKTRLG